MALTSDNPIKSAAEDMLSRSASAESFATEVLSFNHADGLVVGVLGPWGSGKTSFVNLTRKHFEEAGAEVLEFNPWMFSGADQLVDSFFIELSAQLKVRNGMQKVSEGLAGYGEAFSGMAWVPLVGVWVERARGVSKLASKLLERRKEGVGGRRQKLTEALLELARPLIVILDDIDRMTTSEIRDIFKLVRLTASFPNVVYVVAFDRLRVEEALAEHSISGRDYLEKIVQVVLDLPRPSPTVLQHQFLAAVDEALQGIEPLGPFDENAWPDVYAEVIRPLVRNMRDVRRFAASARGAVRELGGQVELVDVLGLEAVRVFLPDVFRQLALSLDGLTSVATGAFGSSEPAHHKLQVERLVAAAGPHRDVATSLIERLFPAARRHVGGMGFGGDWRPGWLQGRRVAHEDVLSLYLERVPGTGYQAFVDGERAWELMGDRSAFDAYLRSLDSARLSDVIQAIALFEDKFDSSHVVPGVTVLLNLLPDIPERPKRGLLDIDTSTIVTSVTLRLLRKLADDVEREAAVDAILPEITTLSSKLELVDDVSHDEHLGHKLVRADFAESLSRQWRSEVRSATLEDLLSEPEPLRILYLTRVRTSDDEPDLELSSDPRLTAALLANSRTVTTSQALGNRAVQTSPRLRWEPLVELFGGEEVLRISIDQLRSSALEFDAELLALTDQYLGGWRPDH